MRVLLTGGAGFIGSHVVDRLVERDHDVVVLDNLDTQVHGAAGDIPSNIEGHVLAGRVRFIRSDLRDRATVQLALDGVDTVAHLAAAVGVGQSMYTPHYYTDVNVAGQGLLLELMAAEPGRFRRLVVASSMSIYGEGAYTCERHGPVAPPPRATDRLARGEWELPCPLCAAPIQPVLTGEDKPLQATSIYAITKKAQEELALCFGAAYRIPTLALRFFNVFGSRQALSNPYTGVAAIFMSRFKNCNPPLVFEDGLQSRDFIHVHDVADAVVRSLELDDDAYGAYNVCTGRPITVRQIADTIASRMGVDIQPEIVGRYRAGDIRHCVGDPTRAREALGLSASTTFEDGIDELLAWSGQQEALDRVADSLAELESKGLVT